MGRGPTLHWIPGPYFGTGDDGGTATEDRGFVLRLESKGIEAYDHDRDESSKSDAKNNTKGTLGSGCQLSVSQLLRTNQLQKSILEQKLILPIVKPVLQLVRGRHPDTLRSPLMIGPHNRPLEKAPDAFYTVRVNVAMYPIPRRYG